MRRPQKHALAGRPLNRSFDEERSPPRLARVQLRDDTERRRDIDLDVTAEADDVDDDDDADYGIAKVRMFDVAETSARDRRATVLRCASCVLVR